MSTKVVSYDRMVLACFGVMSMLFCRKVIPESFGLLSRFRGGCRKIVDFLVVSGIREAGIRVHFAENLSKPPI